MKIFRNLFIVFMVLNFSPALAFDDSRDGLLIGVGLGVHNIHNDYRYDGRSYLTDSDPGLNASFKLGGGIGNQYALYFVHNDSWFNGHITNGGTSKEASGLVSMNGIGFTYFIEPQAPSVYVHAGVGSAYIAYPRENSCCIRTGGAVMLGGGYEFRQHLMFEVTLQGSNVTDQDNELYKIRSSDLQFTLNYLFY